MRTYTNIPVSLMEFALVNRKVNQLKLYIYLKLNSDGYVVYNNQSFNEWAKQLGISSKTIKTTFNWLIENKWISINSKRSSLNIISYSKLLRKIYLNYKSGILFEPSDIKDYKEFKSFINGALIAYYLCKKRYFDRQSAIKKGVANTNCKKVKGFYPMANAYLAKCLGVSISTAFRIKNEAEKAGFVETVSGFSYMLTKTGEKIGKEHFEGYLIMIKKEGLNVPLRKGKRYLMQVESDLVKCILKTKKNYR